MRCRHPICSQPIVVIDVEVGREWCAARHRSDLTLFTARVRKIQGGIEVFTFVMAQAIMPAVQQTAEAIVKLGRALEKARA